MLKKIISKSTNKAVELITGKSLIKDFKELSREIAKHIEKRDYKFSIEYVKKNESEVFNDINYAIDYLDTISPYNFRNIANHQCSYLTNDRNLELIFSITYHTSNKDEQFIERKIIEIANTLRKPNQTDFELVKTVHNYIVLNYSYSETTEHSPYIVFTMLLEKKRCLSGIFIISIKIIQRTRNTLLLCNWICK